MNDYVDLGNISSLILSNNQFTVNYWLKINGSVRVDFFNIKNFNSLQDDIGFFINVNNKISAYFCVNNVVSNNVGGLTSVSTATLSRGVIYNITCMKNESQKIVMYINGVLDNSTYSTNTNTVNVTPTSLWIGSNKTSPTSPAISWNGNIYNVQIYNRALSPQEVLQNYNATKDRFNL